MTRTAKWSLALTIVSGLGMVLNVIGDDALWAAIHGFGFGLLVMLFLSELSPRRPEPNPKPTDYTAVVETRWGQATVNAWNVTEDEIREIDQMVNRMRTDESGAGGDVG